MVGEIVDFFIASRPDGSLQVRPAVVVQDWGGGTLNLQVFTDGLNDRAALLHVGNGYGVIPGLSDGNVPACIWLTSVERGSFVKGWLPRGDYARRMRLADEQLAKEVEAKRLRDRFIELVRERIEHGPRNADGKVQLTPSDYQLAVEIARERRWALPANLEPHLKARPIFEGE